MEAFTVLLLLLSMIASSSSTTGKPGLAFSRALLQRNNPLQLRTILSDIDGTLLSSAHTMKSETIEGAKLAQQAGFQIFPCTGRSRISMANAVGPEFLQLFGVSVDKVPGVYQQGLQVYGTSGELIFEENLEPNVIELVEKFANEHRLSLIAYCGEEIYCKQRSQQTDKIVEYLEPIPTVHAKGLFTLPSQPTMRTVHKLIFLAEDEDLLRVRPLLERAMGASVSVTKAVPGMLEVLPPGASKGRGVGKLLSHLNVEPEDVMSFGDGENDLEMLQLCGLGVAVGNAKQVLKEAANVVLEGSNDDQVVAQCLREAAAWRLDALSREKRRPGA